jgi:Cys-tRNA(Pro)/Cys-tRNA(Cys) deacylase
MCGTGSSDRSLGTYRAERVPARAGFDGSQGQNPVMPASTNAIRLLAAAGVDHEVRAYQIAAEDFSAEAVADAIGLPRARVFKSLVATAGGDPVFAVVPAGSELDLKALAAAHGVRSATLVPTADLERITGYRRGAVTVIGARKRLPIFLDTSATEHDRIAVSAGAPGLQVVLAPADYIAVTGAALARITRR